MDIATQLLLLLCHVFTFLFSNGALKILIWHSPRIDAFRTFDLVFKIKWMLDGLHVFLLKFVLQHADYSSNKKGDIAFLQKHFVLFFYSCSGNFIIFDRDISSKILTREFLPCLFYPRYKKEETFVEKLYFETRQQFKWFQNRLAVRKQRDLKITWMLLSVWNYSYGAYLAMICFIGNNFSLVTFSQFWPETFDCTL